MLQNSSLAEFFSLHFGTENGEERLKITGYVRNTNKGNDIKIIKVNDTAKYFIIIPQNIFKVCCFMKTILYKPKTFPFEFIK